MRFQAFPSARQWLHATLLGTALGCASSAMAQSDMTRLLVAFPPGGPVDFIARSMSQQLAKELGHPVIVENKPGANGAIAADSVIRSAPDGKTLWLTSVGAVAINPALYPKLNYKPASDLVPVSLVVNNVEIMVVNAQTSFKDGKEFVQAASQRKDKPMTMASSGTGSVPHLAAIQLNESAGLNLMHVPYKGAAPAITDLMAGHVDGFFGDIPGLVGAIDSGKFRPVGIAAAKRSARYPNVPTFDELGYKGVDSNNWYAVFAPKGTSPQVAASLSRAIHAALHAPDVQRKIEASGAEVVGSSPEALAQQLATDTEKWTAIIRRNRITPD
ncbi:tripartite tricarboxylate transporter substrate binding protein [Comamonas piscis]|uniref:Tripartite tricarboxylate transporter substrate binding protein n=1 Tax=Comamonas piscis TaxID=1562974 RepID=A0A7G5EBK5_9BURK|nr:tripartite tricarboxylate transporter substrate binding protein [Comamonas piscis]QMV71380.1 tripartite tricarboxylate transporter substrate binding protein [Comamonas piscis]WSO34086.1 tripartite tricarboxylate transporter substrate binding protein [Comamonas piscis]